MKITYVDGEEKTVYLTPRAQTEAEEKFHGIGEQNADSAVRASYWMAWRSLYQAGKEKDDYEKWLDKIADAEVDETEEDRKRLDPTTGEEASPNGSSPSVSEPASVSTT
jgi:hypothetical protein